MPTLPRQYLVRLADYKQKDWVVNGEENQTSALLYFFFNLIFLVLIKV